MSNLQNESEIMMPRHDTLPVPADDWVELSNADATLITFQNTGRTRSNDALIRGTVGSVKSAVPAGLTGGLRYKRFTGIF